MESTVNIKTVDEQVFTVPTLIFQMIHTEKQAEICVPFSSNYMIMLIQYCEHHNYICPHEIIRPLPNDLSQCVSDQWDYEFIKALSFDQAVDLLILADYLKCPSLTDLCYSKIALDIRTASFSDLRIFFRLKDDEFTEAHFKQIKEYNPDLMLIDKERVKELVHDD